MNEYDALQVVFNEDQRVLPLAQALENLPGIHAVRWCGGHEPASLQHLTPASSTRYEGMTHPPEQPEHFWVEAMCDQTIEALDSLYTITSALESYDDIHSIGVSSPWEGITLTIIGTHAEHSPQELADVISETAREAQDPAMPTHDDTTAQVRRRVEGFTQRGALAPSDRPVYHPPTTDKGTSAQD